jgi:hypothetical protein
MLAIIPLFILMAQVRSWERYAYYRWECYAYYRWECYAYYRWECYAYYRFAPIFSGSTSHLAFRTSHLALRSGTQPYFYLSF